MCPCQSVLSKFGVTASRQNFWASNCVWLMLVWGWFPSLRLATTNDHARKHSDVKIYWTLSVTFNVVLLCHFLHCNSKCTVLFTVPQFVLHCIFYWASLYCKEMVLHWTWIALFFTALYIPRSWLLVLSKKHFEWEAYSAFHITAHPVYHCFILHNTHHSTNFPNAPQQCFTRHVSTSRCTA